MDDSRDPEVGQMEHTSGQDTDEQPVGKQKGRNNEEIVVAREATTRGHRAALGGNETAKGASRWYTDVESVKSSCRGASP